MKNILSVGTILILYFLLIFISNLYLWHSHVEVDIFSWVNIRSSLLVYIIFSFSFLITYGGSRVVGIKLPFLPYSMYGIVITLISIFIGYSVTSILAYNFSEYFNGPFASSFAGPKNFGDFLITFIALSFVGVAMWAKGKILEEK